MKEEETTQQQADETPQEQPQTQAVAVKKDASPERTAEAIKRLPAELQGIRNLFAQPWESFRAAFADPQEADRTMQREITYAAQAMTANTYLIECAAKYPQDFVNALKNVALSGLSLSPTLKQGYLVPFKGRVTFMPSYMGMVDLLSNNGHIKKIEAFLVYEGDEFTMTHGTNESLVHKPNPWGERSEKKLLGGYWIATLADDTKLFDNMTKTEIDQIKMRSPSVAGKKSSPWDSDYLAMCRKTILRRGFKSLPKGTISDDRIKVIEAVFDYDEKAEQDWVARQKQVNKRTNADFDEDGEVQYEEIN